MAQEETQKAVLRKVTEGNPNGSDFVVLDFKTTFLDGMLYYGGLYRKRKEMDK